MSWEQILILVVIAIVGLWLKSFARKFLRDRFGSWKD